MTRVEQIGDATLYLGRCEDVLPMLSGVDACITDPPYGIGYHRQVGTDRASSKGMKLVRHDWGKIIGDDAPFDPLPWLQFPKVVLFGANHYADKLPASSAWIVWDKRCDVLSDSYSDCEMAWTNLGGVARVHRQLWKGPCREGEENIAISGAKVHPSQKPVALMGFCITRCGVAHTILDPFAGSGTTGVACARLGRRFIGIECHEPYFSIACRRIEQAQRQKDLFAHAPVPADPQDERMATLFGEPCK